MTQIGGPNSPPSRTSRPGENGPGGTTATTTPTTTEPVTTPPSTTTTAPLSNLDAGASPFTDRFVSGSPGLTSTNPSPTDKKLDAVLSTFQTRIEETLHHDAMSMARGQTPWRNGDPISGEQKSALTDAATDFVKNVPLSALAPGVLTDVERSLSARGIHIDNLADKSLSEVGKVAGDIAGDKAKELANQFKDASPVAFYGLLGGAAVAVGAYGYAKGSGALEKLGIKPELKTGFFNDHVTARVHAAWDPGFKNATLGGNVRGHLDVTSRVNVSAEANFDANKFVDLRLASTIKLSNVDRFVLDAGVNHRGNLTSVSGRYDMLDTDRGLTLSAGARHDFITHSTSADVSLRYQPNANFDFALSGQTNFSGDHRVGVGVRWRF
jgi:hypothetical protein